MKKLSTYAKMCSAYGSLLVVSSIYWILNRELLEQLFKLFDKDRDHCLHQEDWIEFLKQRLTNEKQIDFAEQLESVAFCLCGEKPIFLEQFYQVFHAKGIIDKLFRIIDEENSGVVSSEAIMEFISTITNSRPRTGIDRGGLDRLEQLFRETVGNGKEITKEEFKNIVTSKNPFFTDRVFQIFDKDNSGSISLAEFLDAMHQFAGQAPEDKIRFLFKVYDLDVVITETWLSPDIQDDTVRIQGYGVVGQDRLNRGGGIAIYYKAFLLLEVLENNDSDHTLE
ncbi:hypothetical protein JTB14_011319 [Gonioctena quinquepunctata]|nr:hypothetical protein JTB14_011319 [Gonioctena quinquepunctata]